MTRIIDVVNLEHSETSYEFEGYDHDAGVSFIVVSVQDATRRRRNPGAAAT
jgi:hypothetical protein